MVCVHEVMRPGINWWHLTFYVVAVAAFAARFFAARALGVGLLVSAVGLRLIHLREPVPQPDAFWYELLALSPGLLLLMSSDLRRRFDRAPSGVGWRVNYWGELPRNHWVLSCWVGYSLGFLANLFILPWDRVGGLDHSLSPLAIVLPIYASVLLLFAGRAVAFVISLAVGVAAVVMALPHVVASEASLRDYTIAPAHDLWALEPTHALFVVIAGSLVAALSLPYAVKAVVRASSR